MGEVFVIKGIKPQRLRVAEIRQEILNEMRKEGTDQRRELNKTTRSWKGDKPKFETLIGLDRPPGGATVLTGPTGSDDAVNKWRWLDEGTRIRWAVMSRDWRSKTRPGHFGSGSGSGRVVIAGRRAMQARNIRPRPGIEARNWSEILSKRRKQPFSRRMIQAIQRGARKAF